MTDNINLLLSLIGAREKIPHVIKELRRDKDTLCSELSCVDKKIQRILHIIEHPLDAIKMTIFMKELMRLRKERREIKNNIALLNSILSDPRRGLDDMREAIGIVKGRQEGFVYLSKRDADELYRELVEGDDDD